MAAEFKPSPGERALVANAVGYGITQAEIAAQLKISVVTLHKHFRKELDQGKFKLDMIAGRNVALLMNSKDERTRSDMTRFYLARRMGWKETSVTEQTGKDGGPIETRDVSAVDLIRSQITSTQERLEDKQGHSCWDTAGGGQSSTGRNLNPAVMLEDKSEGNDAMP